MLSITSRALVSRSILVQKYREICDFLIPGCKVDGRLLRVLDGLGRAAAGAVADAASFSSKSSAFMAHCPSAAAAPPKDAAKTVRGRREI